MRKTYHVEWIFDIETEDSDPQPPEVELKVVNPNEWNEEPDMNDWTECENCGGVESCTCEVSEDEED